MIYNALQRGPFRLPGYHDPNDIRDFGVIFRPNIWQANTVYYRRSDDDYNAVIPVTFTGVYFIVENPGKSGASEPTWNYEENSITEDGATGLKWRAVNYNLLAADEIISSVSVVANFGVSITNVSSTSTGCQFRINPLTAAAIAAGYFEVTITATKNTGEHFDTTLLFKVHER